MQITGINLNIQIQICLLYELQLLKVDFYIPLWVHWLWRKLRANIQFMLPPYMFYLFLIFISL